MSPEMQKAIDEQLYEWLRDSLISRSDSPFASCSHLVPKKSGKHRVYVDCKR